jgi:hypothetical protein
VSFVPDGVSDLELRIRQVLRLLSDLEEKYSIKSSRLFESGRPLTDAAIGGREGEVGRELALWLSLYGELKRLEGLRVALEGSRKGRG